VSERATGLPALELPSESAAPSPPSPGNVAPEPSTEIVPPEHPLTAHDVISGFTVDEETTMYASEFGSD
jgi:hypothetical protein